MITAARTRRVLEELAVLNGYKVVANNASYRVTVKGNFDEAVDAITAKFKPIATILGDHSGYWFKEGIDYVADVLNKAVSSAKSLILITTGGKDSYAQILLFSTNVKAADIQEFVDGLN
jgi:hypothetical protein